MSPLNPTLSICIPTFNRLFLLQRSIEFHLQAFRALGIAFEIVVVDDCSTDGTRAYLESQRIHPELSIHTRHQNSGFLSNYAFAMRRARGDFALFLGDDDLLIPEVVVDYVRRMTSDPALGMIQAPWMTVDARPGGGDMGPFYQIPQDFRFQKGQFKQLSEFLLHFHVFPEFLIVRRDVLERTISSASPFIFWAFLYTARALMHADVLFLPSPFARVTAISDDPRCQQGNSETMFKWDHYQGGLEYVVALAHRGALTPPEERVTTLQAIHRFMGIRKKVALRLLIGNQYWAEAYVMIHRIAAYEPLPVTPQQLAEIASLAGLRTAAQEAASFSDGEVVIDPTLHEVLTNALGGSGFSKMLAENNAASQTAPRAYLTMNPALAPQNGSDAVFDVRAYMAQFV